MVDSQPRAWPSCPFYRFGAATAYFVGGSRDIRPLIQYAGRFKGVLLDYGWPFISF